MKNKVIRLFTGPDNQSHFEEIKMPLKDKRQVTLAHQGGKGVTFREWKFINASGVYLSEITGPSKRGWHNAPRRQFLFTLQGEWEIETGDGSKCRFKPGDILLVEDVTGQGHLSRNISGSPQTILVVTLD